MLKEVVTQQYDEILLYLEDQRSKGLLEKWTIEKGPHFTNGLKIQDFAIRNLEGKCTVRVSFGLRLLIFGYTVDFSRGVSGSRELIFSASDVSSSTSFHSMADYLSTLLTEWSSATRQSELLKSLSVEVKNLDSLKKAISQK